MADQFENVGVLSGDTLSVKVSPEVIGADADDTPNLGDTPHSFRSVAWSRDRDDVTVTLEAGFTWLRIRGTPVRFDGFRYFPSDHEGERRPVERADVDFDHDTVPADMHGHDWTVGRLVQYLRNGRVEPADEPDGWV